MGLKGGVYLVFIGLILRISGRLKDDVTPWIKRAAGK